MCVAGQDTGKFSEIFEVIWAKWGMIWGYGVGFESCRVLCSINNVKINEEKASGKIYNKCNRCDQNTS